MGGLDCAFLGFVTCDRFGNVDARRFGGCIAGRAEKIVFVGTFTTGGADLTVAEGRIWIGNDGRAGAFVESVGEATFNGPEAVRRGREVLFVTERCVFRLTERGLALIEVAPGVDLVRHVLRHVPFQPVMDRLGRMDPALFAARPIGLRERLLGIRVDECAGTRVLGHVAVSRCSHPATTAAGRRNDTSASGWPRRATAPRLVLHRAPAPRAGT
jgi:propionate CoA-transferase